MKFILAVALVALCVVTVSTGRVYRGKVLDDRRAAETDESGLFVKRPGRIHREKVPYDRWGAENDPRRECTSRKKAGESCSSDDDCCSYFCNHKDKCITIGG